jgi:hypothetical protein
MKLRVKFNDGRKRVLEVREWSNIHDVKNLIKGVEGIAPERQRLFFRGREVDNSWCVASAEDGCTLFCVVKSSDTSQRYAAKINLCASSSTTARRLRECLLAAQRGLSLNLKPLLAVEGLGGTYFLRDNKKQCVACFKPQDEEPGGINNPRGLVGVHGQIAQERGIKAGEACAREMAAYLLDHHRFAGVPATAMAEASHHSFNHSNGKEKPKLGMLQEYVVHDDVAGDLSPDLFAVKEVHKIGILDIRCVNTDRNEGNILVRYGKSKSEYERKDGFTHPLPKWRQIKRSSNNITLVPIDHGYCFPKTFNVGWCDWCWLGWKQALKPFDKDTLEYISKLDPDADIERLRKETDIPKECLRNSKIATVLLKQGAAAGLVLFEIADIMSRSKLDRPSDLEEAVARAQAMAKAFLKSPRARGLLNAEMNYHSDSSPMLSPPRRHKINNKSRSTGKSKTNAGSRPAIAGNDYGNQTPSPITKPLNGRMLNISNPLDDNDGSGGSNNINRNLLNAFEMSPIHEARSKKEDESSFQTKKAHKFKEIEHALSSMLLSPVEESSVDFDANAEEKINNVDNVGQRRSDDATGSIVGMDVDADDEGGEDDEEEFLNSYNTNRDCVVSEAKDHTKLLPTFKRKKSVDDSMRPPRVPSPSQIISSEKKKRPRVFEASPLIRPASSSPLKIARFFDTNVTTIEETKTKGKDGLNCFELDGAEIKEMPPYAANTSNDSSANAFGVDTSPIMESTNGFSNVVKMQEGGAKVSNGVGKSPQRPRVESLCTSDDETFLRSPARASNEKSNSSDGGSSPKSVPTSPTGPSALTRTFSYSEAMFSLPGHASNNFNSGPRTLRARRSGDNLDAVYGDPIMFDKCFFGYLEKLLSDLISFRLRTRKAKEEKRNNKHLGNKGTNKAGKKIFTETVKGGKTLGSPHNAKTVLNILTC